MPQNSDHQNCNFTILLYKLFNVKYNFLYRLSTLNLTIYYTFSYVKLSDLKCKVFNAKFDVGLLNLTAQIMADSPISVDQ